MARLKKIEDAMKRNERELGEGMKALADGGGAEGERPVEKDGPVRKGPRNTAVSFTAEEYEFIRKVFEEKAYGMKAATGIKMAALYVADRLDRGLIAMTRAGISERR
jgi:hypothetical protein